MNNISDFVVTLKTVLVVMWSCILYFMPCCSLNIILTSSLGVIFRTCVIMYKYYKLHVQDRWREQKSLVLITQCKHMLSCLNYVRCSQKQIIFNYLLEGNSCIRNFTFKIYCSGVLAIFLNYVWNTFFIFFFCVQGYMAGWNGTENGQYFIFPFSTMVYKMGMESTMHNV